MKLVVDVGNTETVVGLLSSPRELRADWRVSSSVPRTADEMVVLVRAFLAEEGIGAGDLQQGVVGSVVPSTTHVWTKTLERLTQEPVVTVGPESPLPIRLDVDEPLTVGADRIVNTLAARDLYGRDTIAVDLGTATTFDCISGDGTFLGGVISPGLPAGLDWLDQRTAMLPRVALDRPATVIGRRTETCIQSGVFFSAIEAIDGVVRLIKAEWGRSDAWVVATGGFAKVVGHHLATVDHIEPFLTLYGLAMAGDYIRLAKG
jgi:type III pantothenate kinase